MGATNHEALFSAEEFALVGLNDIKVVDGSGGPMFFTARRGDGWLTACDLGNGPRNTGLNNSDLTGVRLNSNGVGNTIDVDLSYSASGRNLSGLSEMMLVGDGNTGLGALRTGGLINISLALAHP